MKKIIAAVALFASIQGCSTVDVTQYQDIAPSLVLEDFFNGPLTAHGVVKNRAGLVIRTFNAELQGSWEDGIGTLVEDFIFDDGEQQQRTWTLKPQGPDTYTGAAGDVIGVGQLELSGNSLFMDYTLRIPYGESSIDVKVDDRMYLIDSRTLINESILKKYGVTVGGLTLVILKQADE